jgi:hypothetical protein
VLPTELETLQPEAAKQVPRRLPGRGLADPKFARFISLSRRACQEVRLAIGMWSVHGFTQVTRPAPADESAGCGSPSPRKGARDNCVKWRSRISYDPRNKQGASSGK